MYYSLFLFLLALSSCQETRINQINYNNSSANLEVLNDQNTFKESTKKILKQEVVIKPEIEEVDKEIVNSSPLSRETKNPVGIFLKSFVLLEEKSCENASFKFEKLTIKTESNELDFIKNSHLRSETMKANKKDSYNLNLMLVADPLLVFTKQTELKIVISIRVETTTFFGSVFNIKNTNPIIVLFGESPDKVLKVNLGEDDCVGELAIYLGQAVKHSSFSNTWKIQGMD